MRHTIYATYSTRSYNPGRLCVSHILSNKVGMLVTYNERISMLSDESLEHLQKSVRIIAGRALERLYPQHRPVEYIKKVVMVDLNNPKQSKDFQKAFIRATL